MSAEFEVVVDDLPPVDEPEEIIEDLPPVDEPEEIIEDLPPVDEPEEHIEELPPVDEPEEIVEELPPVDEPEEIIEDLPPVDEPEEHIEELPPVDEPEEVIEEIPPVDDAEEIEEDDNSDVEGDLPIALSHDEAVEEDIEVVEPTEDGQPSVGITAMPHLVERNEMARNQPMKPPTPEPEDVVEYHGIEYKENAPVEEELITGNEDVGPLGKMKKRVNVQLEADYKAPQIAPQIFDKNRDAAYEKQDKARGDIQYVGEGHGKILVVEEANGTDGRMLHNDYYSQGYTGAQGHNLGKERQKAYGYDRAIRRRVKNAPDLVKKVEPARPKRQKQKPKEKKTKKKKKKKIQYGTPEYPLKMVEKNRKIQI